ncbi:MAG: hypothetical protein BAJATHORv1_30114 [Candidatus Thorarchaeota archaeon]|nr:MAG: hypothetical protein BAJATHORv1_30114 [Candidatus Thorarchaeota archaeon]
MDSGEGYRGNRLLPIIVIITSLILAFVFWWTNGVLAILLLVIAMASCIISACRIPFGPSEGTPIVIRTSQSQRRTRRRVRREDPFEPEPIAIDEIINFEEADTSEEIGDIEQDLPIEIIDGIGQSYGALLRDMNIDVVKKLTVVEPELIQDICQIDRETAEHWIADAQCIIEGARIYSILELAMSEPSEVLFKIERAIEKGKLNLPESYEIKEWKIRQWIDTANDIMSTISSDDIRRWKGDL